MAEYCPKKDLVDVFEPKKLRPDDMHLAFGRRSLHLLLEMKERLIRMQAGASKKCLEMLQYFENILCQTDAILTAPSWVIMERPGQSSSTKSRPQMKQEVGFESLACCCIVRRPLNIHRRSCLSILKLASSRSSSPTADHSPPDTTSGIHWGLM